MTIEEQLIDAIFQRRPIWDPADETRKNANILKVLWSEVAEEVGLDVKTARAKWKNLRAYFVSQLRELENPKNGRTSTSWSYFNQLMFLKDAVLTNKLKYETAGQDVENVEVCPSFFFDEKPMIHMNIGENIESKTGDTSDFSDEEDYSEQEKRRPNKKRKLDSFYKNCNQNKNVVISDLMERKLELLGDKFEAPWREGWSSLERRLELLEKKLNTEDDSDLLFFRSLIPYLKDFTLVQKLRIRSNIQNLILAEFEASSATSGT